MTAPVTTTWPTPPGSLGHLLSQTATISHVGELGTDSYGNPEKSIASIDVAPCILMPMVETEQLLEAETAITEYRLILGPGVPIAVEDQVAVAGVPYICHEALPWVNPRTGAAHHVEARVAVTTG